MKKTVLITGSSSGFGAHLAEAFAARGYDVVLHGRNKKRLQAVKNKISKKGVRCVSVIADLQTKKGLNTVQSTLHKYNVDILVNNAGVNPELKKGALGNAKNIGEIISVNTSSAIALSREAFSYFAKRGGGIVININSSAGLRGSAHEAVYAASKFGLRGFSESVKEIWLKQGVRMIDIYSGALATGMSSGRRDKNELIDPRELAEFIASVCSTNSFFIREISIQRTKKSNGRKVEKQIKTEYHKGI
ncbi:SDR family oxidoreductase [Patescibacteria group bacterium]|nr:SDR family oxidoreductase [Patescibacteria group bacterium]MCL5114552.1 SDR family oxidoreductase [Patescibacteria group bacterium]